MMNTSYQILDSVSLCLCFTLRTVTECLQDGGHSANRNGSTDGNENTQRRMISRIF